MYAGVGLGIALSAESVVWGAAHMLTSPQMWLLLALIALIITAAVLHGLIASAGVIRRRRCLSIARAVRLAQVR